jgi:hypothetical protein
MGAIAGLGVLAWLAFGYFGVHTLFIDDVVSEAAPVFDEPAVVADEADGQSAPVTSGSIAEAVEVADVPTTTTAVAPAPAEPVPATAPTTTIPAMPEIVTEASGQFTSAAHSTAGEAVVLGNGTGQRFLRFEDFETDNGPDLNVYLVNSSTGDVSDFVDLGDLKGNVGEQNYEIPDDVDLSVYDTVWIWCVRFSSGFGSAELATT